MRIKRNEHSKNMSERNLDLDVCTLIANGTDSDLYTDTGSSYFVVIWETAWDEIELTTTKRPTAIYLSQSEVHRWLLKHGRSDISENILANKGTSLNVTVSIRLSSGLKAKLDSIAKADDRTLNWLLVKIVNKYLNDLDSNDGFKVTKLRDSSFFQYQGETYILSRNDKDGGWQWLTQEGRFALTKPFYFDGFPTVEQVESMSKYLIPNEEQT